MVIIKQCLKCRGVDKKMYCNDCEKSIDYFQVFEDVFDDNQNNIPTLIHTIKAYTWNDVIKFVKDEYFKDQNDLIIDCEKEFAYLKKHTKSDNLMINPVKQSTSYKIYLKSEHNLDFYNLEKSTILIDLTKVPNNSLA